MSREKLANAARDLSEAAEETTDDIRGRLENQATQLRDLANRERGPDHGRLARHQQKLNDIQETVEETVADQIQQARDRISSYREGIEGV